MIHVRVIQERGYGLWGGRFLTNEVPMCRVTSSGATSGLVPVWSAVWCGGVGCNQLLSLNTWWSSRASGSFKKGNCSPLCGWVNGYQSLPGHLEGLWIIHSRVIGAVDDPLPGYSRNPCVVCCVVRRCCLQSSSSSLLSLQVLKVLKP